ncbi:MAG: histidine--tRNA ligase [Chloroflexi bacterium RBG_16_57_8]|nr:MAG: histidine--tRNA ligase [Chloroflexi bacterium RBG_16_57_8]
MKQIIRPVRGTRDFYPEQMAFRQWLYGRMREVSQRFGYQEYEGPVLETLDLYAAKSGEELVNEQSYVFTDRGGDRITLRPELTPTLARMVAQKQREIPKPIRWWSFGPFWRYERPQKGRSREFFQWNLDIIGVESSYADAEVVAVLAEFLRSVGLAPQQVGIKVSNRRLMKAQIETLGVEAGKVDGVYRLIDKLDKLSPADWLAYGKESTGLDDVQLQRLRSVLNDRELWKESPDLVLFFGLVRDLGVSEFVEFDASIIRGLAYYTDLVFEVWDRQGAFRAILGGGRYANLLADVGGDPMGGVGFAMGDVVIGLVLEQYGLKPQLRPSATRALVTVFSPDLLGDSARIAAQLRASGINTELYPEAAKLDRQLKYANTQGIPFAVILGPDEVAAGKATVKDLGTGKQQSVMLGELAGVLAVT